MGALARIVTGRRSKWLVVLVWLVLILPFGRSARKLADATDNRTESFLPAERGVDRGASPPGAAVSRRRERQRADRLPAPGRPDRRPTARDRRRRRARLRGDPARGTGRGPVRGDLAARARVAGRRPRVHDRRRARRQRPARGVGYRPPRCGRTRSAGGLEVYVTGALGFNADFEEVFGDLDAKVLLVTVALVLVLLRLIYRSPVIALIPLVVVGFAYTIAQRARLPLRRVGRDGLGQRRDDPRGADVRGGDGLLPAAGLALPRGAAKPRGQARGDGARDPAHRPGDPGQRPDRRADDARAALANIGSTHSLGPVSAIGVDRRASRPG